MFRLTRVITLLVLLFSLSSPSVTQAATTQSTTPRLVVFEGFYAPG